MPSFTVRVELHKADPTDYYGLYREMESEGALRTVSGSDGVTYTLPTAEYIFDGDYDSSQVRAMAQVAVARTNKKASILVTQSVGRAWSGLEISTVKQLPTANTYKPLNKY